MKTLVVDDDLTCRSVLEDVMSRFGPVDTCADGVDAVSAGRGALDRGEPYDLICMDILMPAMSGIEALQQIRAAEEEMGRERTSKVIMITGSGDTGYVSQAFGQFCDAYIVKPIDIEALLGILECLCPGAAR